MEQHPRSWLLRIIVLVIGLVMIGRYFQLQVIDDRYKIWASDQAIYRKVVYPARGTLIDRNGKTLLYNEVIYDLFVTPDKIKSDMDTAYFCKLLEISRADFDDKVKKAVIRNGKLRQGIFISQMTTAQNARLQEEIFMFPAFEITERSSRKYNLPIGAHIYGYTSEITPAMLKETKYAGYRQGDYIGITGLEHVYEDLLKGTRGVAYYIRDVMNRPILQYKNGELDTPAISGSTLKLTIDADVQALAERLMQGKMGSAIAIDPKTGGIIAMVSAPSFDPNLLTGPDRNKNFMTLQEDYTGPLYNRAVQGKYPPGSTFKPITALVGLDVGVITPSFGLPCGGGYYHCGKRIGCTHSGGGHSANIRAAMANSCNSYFCHTFRLVVDSDKYGSVHKGIDAWVEYMHKFGFGKKLGIDITGEIPGFIADNDFYTKRNKSPNYSSCNMASTGMGQDALEITPLQLANSMCIIANRGYYYTPHFVHAIDGNTNAPALKPFKVKHEATSHIPDQYYQAVIDGMEDVVVAGTGRVAQLPGIKVCGKTGTVENKAIINGKVVKLDNHSVFVAFAPKDDPKIAIAVVVQNSGYGATWAGPVSTLMMEQYLNKEIKRNHLVTRMESARIIKPYIRYLDSVQRAKDFARYLTKNASRREQDSIRKIMDTMVVREVLSNFNIKSKYYRKENEIN